MKVFISWSGDMSRELAEALRDWLPSVLQSIKPFFTPSDIEKGARWGKDIAQELDASAIGIFCLTKENLTKPWIMFEAGALSKNLNVGRVCPILFGVENSELQGPLVQFQASPFSEGEMRKLIRTLNNSLGEQKLEDGVLNNVFNMWWGTLQEKVQKILAKYENQPGEKKNERSERELIEEILQLTRLNAKNERKNKSPNDAAPLMYVLRRILDAIDSGELTQSVRHNMVEMTNALEFYLYQSELSNTDKSEIEALATRIRHLATWSPPAPPNQ